MNDANRDNPSSREPHSGDLPEIVRRTIDGEKTVSLARLSLLQGLLKLLGKKKHPGIRTVTNRDDSVTVDVDLYVRPGKNIPDVARGVQSRLREALEEAAKVTVNKININVRGIERRIR